MASKKISAREVMLDIGAGLSNDEIGRKYGLSEKGTQILFDKLLSLNLVTSEEHRQRLSFHIRSVEPADGNGGSAVHEEDIVGRSDSPPPKSRLRGASEDNGKCLSADPIRGDKSVEAVREVGLNGQEAREDPIPAPADFIDGSKQGKNEWWRYLVSLVFILIFSTIMSVVALQIWGPDSKFDNKSGSYIGLDTLENYILVNLPFVFIFVSILFVTRYEHKRPFLTLFTPGRSIHWKQMGKSFGLFSALLSISLIIDCLLAPEEVQFCFDPVRFFAFLPVVLLLTPLQCATEELFYRGYLLQMLALLSRNRYALVVITGLLFMVPHLANPEIEKGLVVMILYYSAVGAFLTLVTLRSNGLEAAIGIHSATNLFAAVIVSYSGSALKTESILFCTTFDPLESLVSFSIMAIVYYVLMFEGQFSRQWPWFALRRAA